MMERLLQAKEVAGILGVHLSTVYAWVQQGFLPYVCLSQGARKNCIRFKEGAIEEWIEERSRPGRLDRIPSRSVELGQVGCAGGAPERR
jgi:excisionase family DNA binding protein